jgi:two-component system sensor histidine kinase VicK
MWAFFEVSKILGSPLGSLVYHLLLLLAIEAVLGMAWDEWRRARRGPAQRLLIGFGGMALVRLGYIVAALLAMAGLADRTTLLPPLERFADTASLAFLAWALARVPHAAKVSGSPAPSPARLPREAYAADRQAQTWNLFLTATLVLASAACAASVVLWGRQLATAGAASELDYNLTWQAAIWSGWQIGLAILVGLAVLRNRHEGWTESRSLLFLAIVVILAGQILQMASALGVIRPSAVPHLPTWERLANLIAYPLLVIALYQNIVVGLRLRSRQLQDISQASMDQIKSLLFLFEASREMSSSLDLPTVLDNAAQGIARALDADQCAIAFPQDNDPGQMRLAAIFNPARHGRGEGVAFPLDYQLAVQQALRRKRYVIVEEADNVQLKVLFALLGSSDIGPLLIQPLVSDNNAIGAIIVGNSRSQRLFTANEAKLCQSMADQLVGAIQNARRYRALQAKSEETARSLAEEHRASQQARAQTQDLADRLASVQAETEDIRRREETAREARNALEIKLVSSRAESESLTDRLAMLESDLAQTHANAEAQLNWQKIELARQEAAWQEAFQSQDRLQTILHSLTAGLIVADREGRIVEANVASEILLDRDTEELKGANLQTISDDPRWKQAVLTASGGDAPAVRLTITVGSDPGQPGRGNTLLCDIAPVSGTEAGHELADGIVVVMQDISTEIDEYQSNKAVVAQLALKTQELQSSLATAANYANLVLSDIAIPEAAVPEAQRSGAQRGVAAVGTGQKFLLRLRTSVERAAQVADELVHLAAGSSARHRTAGPSEKQAERATVDVNHLIETAVADSQPKLKDKDLVLDLDLPDRLPAVEVDLDDLRRVMTNLLHNACLVSPAGGHIRVQASHSRPEGGPRPEGVAASGGHAADGNGNSFVIISVRDWGGGLPHEALDKVFDRTRPGQTPQGLGASGLELALVKALIESQRGYVWVETENGVGTTFSLALPIEERG